MIDPEDDNIEYNLPPYLDRIEELEYLDIVRLKGNIDKEMVPVIERRIRDNRRAGGRIDKNVLVDYALVEKIDSATIAFHLVRLEEYRESGFHIGFINVTDEMKAHLEVMKHDEVFKVYESEEEAIADLNRPNPQ